ncbi:adenosine deaminase [Dictyobacter vulcani]|uniref:adenosine deaminase n=1 Tax=Dictyobacter vulcani TaxID=2607529 RepID=A0A5J4KVL6_9CHLR|nr:adenosine deaminase [Dictyobacter vulcani]GER91192.1 adenosine deaminase [Dictyobacter vulcani]
MDIHAYPKVELHLHLDCSLSYEVVHTIDPTVTEEIYHREFVAPAKCINLVDFLKRAPMGIALMQTPQHLRLVVKDLFAQLQRDNVIYAEIRFAPLLHTEQGLTPAEVVRIVEAATSEASAETGIEARLLLCALRHFTAEESLQTVRLVEQFQGTTVAGLDLAGDEAGYPLDAHIPAFQYAIEHGLARTAHAGEARGAASVWETLEHLQPTRIGHGVRSSEDPNLLDKLRAEGIHLELCPMSNLQTNIYDIYADHPIDYLYRQGVALNVNTDCRMITPVTLKREYEQLHANFQWNKQDFLTCNLYAVEAAFIPAELKHRLKERLQEAYAACD